MVKSDALRGKLKDRLSRGYAYRSNAGGGYYRPKTVLIQTQ
jgi:hypothetical protein